MREDQRIWTVKDKLLSYVKSPSLKHIRDPYSVDKLAREIVQTLDRANSIWTKWDGQRETVLKSCIPCWIPLEDLHEYLNAMPGPLLTKTDVAQRLRAFEDEEHWERSNEDLKQGCLEIYAREKSAGTELPAIIGLLRDHVEVEEARVLRERQDHFQQLREQDRVTREQRLKSGADCPWTSLGGSLHWYCRRNGRTYRLSPTKDKKWDLFRVESVTDTEAGTVLGRYQTRGDATKAVSKIAYSHE